MDKQRSELVVWTLFLASAVFFIAEAVRDGSGIAIAAAAFFFLACVVHLAGLVVGRRR